MDTTDFPINYDTHTDLYTDQNPDTQQNADDHVDAIDNLDAYRDLDWYSDDNQSNYSYGDFNINGHDYPNRHPLRTGLDPGLKNW